MPKALENKLKKEYGANSSIPYKIMNSMGLMHGNKVVVKQHMRGGRIIKAHVRMIGGSDSKTFNDAVDLAKKIAKTTKLGDSRLDPDTPNDLQKSFLNSNSHRAEAQAAENRKWNKKPQYKKNGWTVYK